MKIDDLIDKVDAVRFFNQRAGRELWQEKPKEIQNVDIKNADNILDEVKKYLDKYRWHDLRKDPNDLPKAGERVLVLNNEHNTNIDWLDIFNSDIQDWKFARREIIAWKYIETFEEVE